jgi:hypothetical protein
VKDWEEWSYFPIEEVFVGIYPKCSHGAVIASRMIQLDSVTLQAMHSVFHAEV